MNEKEIMVKMALETWRIAQERISKFIDSTPREHLDAQVAPERNSAKWIIAHLAVVNDYMINVLGIGDSIMPSSVIQYFTSKDSIGPFPLSNYEVVDFWNQTREIINERISKFSVDDWFSKHNTVSDEDFQKEPHRNKLNIILTRAFHISHHVGQLVLIPKKI